MLWPGGITFVLILYRVYSVAAELQRSQQPPSTGGVQESASHKDHLNSVEMRCIVKTGGLTRGGCKSCRLVKLKAFNKGPCISGKKEPKGSNRCFPNGVFQIPHLGLRQRKAPADRQRVPESTSVFKHFGSFCAWGC